MPYFDATKSINGNVDCFTRGYYVYTDDDGTSVVPFGIQ